MTKTLINTYAHQSSAARAAKRQEIANPAFEQQEDGRIALFSIVKRIRKQKTTGPVAEFRKLFNENFGKVTWSAMIDLAVAAGIQKNTAKTYYYKLKAEHEARVEAQAA